MRWWIIGKFEDALTHKLYLRVVEAWVKEICMLGNGIKIYSSILAAALLNFVRQ